MSSTLSAIGNQITTLADGDLMYVDQASGPTDASIAWSDLKAYFRKKLTADITYYVRSTGNDSHDGTSSGTAWLTITHAWDWVCANIDIAGYKVRIDGGGDTFTDSLDIDATPSGGGAIEFYNLTWNGGATCFRCVKPVGSQLLFTNVTVSNSSGDHALDFSLATAVLSGVNCTGSPGAFVSAGPDANVLIDTVGWSVSGNIRYVVQAIRGGYLYVDGALVTASSPVTMTAFTCGYIGGLMESYGLTKTGSFTGQRYAVNLNGIVNTFGSGPSYFPGSSAGTGGTGNGTDGIYV